jgi:hypothetical protein
MFRCDYYVHVPFEVRKKLEKNTKVYKLLGYSENVKGYRLYDIQSNKVIVNRDVVFNGFKTNLN